MIDTIRISQRAKEQLIWLKRQTGINQWNVLCRWALCLSMADPASIGDFDDAADSNVEMRWEVFAGEYDKIYLGLITERCRKEGQLCQGKNLARFVRQHLHRGISKLVVGEKITTVSNLIECQRRTF
jgi:DNA sulfur modification protein DndE